MDASNVKRGIALLFAVFMTVGAYAQTTLVLQPGPANGKDVMVISNAPDSAWYTYPDFIAACWTNNGPFTMRSFIDFDLSPIPSNATIISAHLSLYCNNNSSNSQLHSGANQSELRRITAPWVDTFVTWNNQPATDMVGKIVLQQSINSIQDYPNINVTSHIQYKHANPGMHHGFMLRLTTEGTYRSIVFASSNHPMPGLRPRLVIVYNAPVLPANCPSFSVHNVTICPGDSFFSGGAYQFFEGLYYDTLVSASLTDSVLITALHVQTPVQSTTFQQICFGDSIQIHGQWRKEPGIYPQVFATMHGCDSTSQVALDVFNVNNSVGFNGAVLTASESGAAYQWVDCDLNYAPIPGANTQSFTPATPGNYAVLVTKQGCTALSPCISAGMVSAGKSYDKGSFVLIPNPVTHGELTLLFDRQYSEAHLRIHSFTGQHIMSLTHFATDRATVALHDLAKGMYLVTVTADGMSMTQPFIVR